MQFLGSGSQTVEDSRLPKALYPQEDRPQPSSLLGQHFILAQLLQSPTQANIFIPVVLLAATLAPASFQGWGKGMPPQQQSVAPGRNLEGHLPPSMQGDPSQCRRPRIPAGSLHRDPKSRKVQSVQLETMQCCKFDGISTTHP